MAAKKAVTVKLDTDLYQTVSDVSAVTGVSIRELIERSLRREITGRLKDRRLQTTIETMRDFRAPA